MTTTLRIEHPISDFDTWLEAFGRCSGARQSAGVRAHRVFHLVGDPLHIMIDLDFDTLDAAAAFREFLTTVIWATPENAPALSGTPNTALLEGLPA
jgi:hypothetical protein